MSESTFKGSAFSRSFGLVMDNEGGLLTQKEAQHIGDHSRETMYGITQETLTRLRFTLRARDLTLDDAQSIYYSEYWRKPNLDRLSLWSPGVAIFLFDAGVQHGPSRAVRWLQHIVGTTVDGILGPHSIGTAEKYGAVPCLLDLAAKRRRFLRQWIGGARGAKRVARERARKGVMDRVDRTLRYAVFEEIENRPTQHAAVLWRGRGFLPAGG